MSTPPATGSKEDRIAAAQSRIEFWTIWSQEAQTPSARVYFKSRLNHWQNVLKALDFEE